MDILIRAEASVNIADDKGRTLLMFAGSLPCLKLLLEVGADIKVVNRYNMNALHYLFHVFGPSSDSVLYESVPSENKEAIRLLVSKGAALKG